MGNHTGFFITGTSTGVGKTLVSALLVAALEKSGRKPLYFKPAQTGDDDDTHSVLSLSGLSPTRACPPAYRFAAPMAPSRAAALEGQEIHLSSILSHWDRWIYENLSPNGAGEPVWIVEGAGGLLVPLNQTDTNRELVREIDLPVILVASTTLGTINHTLLTLESMKNAGLSIAGIILNGPEDPGLRETLESFGQVPVIAEIDWLEGLNPPRFAQATTKLLEQLVSRFTDLFKSSPSGPASPGAPRLPDLSERDGAAIWHPYTQHGLNTPALPVKAARGLYLELEDGRKIVDASSSWWVNLHGHCRPEIATAIAAQAHTLEHVIFAGFTHRPAVELSEVLIQAAQARGCPDIRKVFFSDNGSTAIEAAMKIAYQFHWNRGSSQSKKRRKFLALKHSYHGDTFGAMAVSEPDGFHTPYRDLMATVDFVEPGDLASLEAKLTAHPEDYAAFVFEPLVQGAGGMRFYGADFLKGAEGLCRQHGVLLVADEIFTGFYRTGKLFAFEHAGISPDLICLSKGITGGFLPLAITLSTEAVYEAFLSRDWAMALPHGHSYTANPISCAAAVASWRLLMDPSCQERIQVIARETQLQIEQLRDHPKVSSARSLGTIGALNIGDGSDYSSNLGPRIKEAALERGVLLRPLGNVLYTLPPYCADIKDISSIYSVVREILDIL